MPDPTGDLDQAGGPPGAPRSFIRRIVAIVVGFVVFVAAAAGAIVLFAKLPSGTGAGSLAARGVVAGVVGLILVVMVRRMARSLAAPSPPPPQTVDARESEVVYVCPVCGTRVRLELAATAKAPRHCGEEMEPQLARY